MDLDNLTSDISNEDTLALKHLLNNRCGYKQKDVDEDDEVEEAETEAEVINISILKKMVIRWLKLDDFIRDRTKEIKDTKDEKTQIEDKILAFMQHTEQDEIPVKDEKLKRKKTETKEKIDEEYIKKVLTQTMPGNIEMVDKLTNVIITNRSSTVAYKLTRTGKGK
jgi:hypothetical protein